MKHQFKIIGILILFLLSNSSFSQKEYTQDVNEKIKQVETNLGSFTDTSITEWTLQERMKYYKVPGLSIAVINNYKIQWTKGYGFADTSDHRLVTPETLFEPGSLSKSINAMGVLKLVSDKNMDINKDINQYLKSWKFPYDSLAKNKTISIKNLLSHTAGLSVHGFMGYKNGDRLPSITQVLDGIKPANSEPVRSMIEPNLKFEYSGGGTIITELIIMDMAKMPYDKYISKTVLKPLGMEHSFFTQPPPKSKAKLLATGYDSKGVAIEGKYPVLIEQAAGGLWVNPSDLCKFIIETQLSLNGKSNKILSQSVTEQMLEPYIDNMSALGIFINEIKGEKYFWHDAGNLGFSGVYYGSFENGNGVAIFINSENSDILREVFNSVAASYNWKGFESHKTKKTITVTDTIFEKYIGEYEMKADSGKITHVSIIKNDSSYWWISNNTTRKMYFTSETDFFNMESPSEKTFYFNNNGTVKGYKSSYNDKIINFEKVVK